MTRPLILITNDDGIHASGIEHLIRIAATLGDVVVAASGHCPVRKIIGTHSKFPA